MKPDFDKLENRLEALTGYDFEIAERETRAVGDRTPDITFSKDFQSRLAAKALGVEVEAIKKLKINEFVMVTTRVSNFLLGSLVGPIREDATKK